MIKKVWLNIILYLVLSIILHLIFKDLRLEYLLSIALIPQFILAFIIKEIRNLVLALISGQLIYYSFPDLGYWYCIYIAFIPLFFIAKNVDNYKKAFFYGLITGIITMTGGFYWLVYTIEVFGHLPYYVSALVFLAYSIVFGLKFPILMMGLRWGFKNNANRFLFFPIVITLADFLVFEHFQWYFANSQFYNNRIIQFIEFTGLPGLNFLLILWNVMIFELIMMFKGQRPFPLKGVAVTALITVLLFGYGSYRIMDIEERKQKVEPLVVSCIQPNTPMGKKDRQKVYNVLSSLTSQAIDNKYNGRNIDLVVWPESAAPFSYKYQPAAPFTKYVNKTVREKNVYFFFGGTDWKRVKGKGSKTYNSAHLLAPDFEISQPYYKTYLVPFGEFMPLGETFDFLYKISDNLKSGFTPGESIEVFKHPKAMIAPSICYEIIIPGFTRKFIQKGGEVIVNITNDAWFGNTKASKLHLVVASFRAVENRVPIVRSTNSGITCLIDSLGKVVTRETELYKEEYLTGAVYPLKIKTFYTEYGDIFSYLLIIMLFILYIKYRNISIENK